MNISDIINHTIAKITGAKEKAPVIMFGVMILSALYGILNGLIIAFGGLKFFAVIATILGVLAVIAVIALAVYLFMLYAKGKNVFHLVAGILLLVNLFLGGILSVIVWIVIALCFAMPSLKSEDEDAKSLAKFLLIVAVVQAVLNIISSFIGRPLFIVGLFSLICNAVSVVRLALMLAVFLRDVELIGGAKDVAGGLVDKAKNMSKSNSAPEAAVPAAEAPVAEEPAAYESAPAAEPSDAAVAAVMAAAAHKGKSTTGSGRYQYKTVAGPIGLIVEKNTSYSDGVKQYAAIIDREAVGGWVLDSIHEIPVTKRNGCIAALMGRPTTTINFNMLVFCKED